MSFINQQLLLALVLLLGGTSGTTAQSTVTPPANNSFRIIHEMPMARSDMTATAVGVIGIKVYLVGGCVADQNCGGEYCYCPEITNKTHIYNVGTDSYDTNVADAPRARYRHAAVEHNGSIYLFGGRDIADNLITEVDAYNIAEGTWSTPCTWANATSDLSAVTELVDGSTQILLFGGYFADYSTSDSTTQFVPAVCSFVQKTPMPWPRGDLVSVSVETFTGPVAFVVGGFNTDWCNAEATVASYDLAADQWTVRSPLVLGRADLALGEINGHIYAIGGETVNEDCSGAKAVTDVERLDRNDTERYGGDWVVQADLPSNRFRYTGVSYRNTIFTFGGQGSWVDNIDGSGAGGYPVLNTTMIFIGDVADRTQACNDDCGGSESSNTVTYIVIAIAGALTVVVIAVVIIWYRSPAQKPRSAVNVNTAHGRGLNDNMSLASNPTFENGMSEV